MVARVFGLIAKAFLEGSGCCFGFFRWFARAFGTLLGCFKCC